MVHYKCRVDVMVYEVRKELKEKEDKWYKAFNEKIGITNNVIGVRMPELKKMARELAKKNYQEYLNKDLKYHEEIMLQGLIIGSLKESQADMKQIYQYLDEFVPKINNWAICDTVVWKLKIVQNNQEYFKTLILKYLKSDKEYELRFAIVLMLAYYLTDDYIDWVLEEIQNICYDGYYVKMAIAWLIATAYVDYPKKITSLLKSQSLDIFTHNKSIQKIQESKLVSPQRKEELKSLKRK